MHSSSISPKPTIQPRTAIGGFLKDMAKVARRTFPEWHKTLTAGIEDCTLGYDQHRAVLEIHPLEDYYLAGIVALEAAKLRALFAPDEAAELLSLLGEQVDAVAERNDHMVSDLVLFIMGRVEIAAAADPQKMPHDQVVKAILQRLGLDKIEATQHLMSEILYRHNLGQPLALEVPHWWSNFQKKYRLSEPKAQTEETMTVSTPAPQAIARKPHRAAAF